MLLFAAGFVFGATTMFGFLLAFAAWQQRRLSTQIAVKRMAMNGSVTIRR
jgi:hypothetical protein